MNMKLSKWHLPIEYWIFGLLWLVILLPKYIQLAFFGGIAVLLLCKNGFSLKMNTVSAAMLLLFAVHIFAIAYDLAVLNGPRDRFAAAINTAILWPIAAIYYAYYSNRKTLDMDIVGGCCCFNLLAMSFFAVLTVYLFYIKGVGYYSIFGKTLYETTYLSGKITTKFFGLNDYSNMNLFYLMLNTTLALPYLRKKKVWIQLIILGIASFEVLLINSRAGMILFTLALLFALLELLIPIRYRKAVFFLTMGLVLVGAVMIFPKLWQMFLDKIIYGNTSSTGFRVSILTESIREAWEMSPIWGMGIKRYFAEGYPLGSHSTYVGFFYKTGFIGLILGMFVFVKTNWQVLRRIFSDGKIRLVAMFLLSFAVLFAIEDVDGTNWSAMLYFSALAILAGRPGGHESHRLEQTKDM